MPTKFSVVQPDDRTTSDRKLEAAEHIAILLIRTEATFDVAIGQLALLGASIANTRVGAGMAAEFTQGSLEDLASTSTATVAARRALVTTHRRLAAMQRGAGLGAISFGAGDGKPLPVPNSVP
ncbi:hypothetical protein FHS96_005780 [Sphingomonas zeicaulis]|uniref:hypothetical protein n=1 Tax=Sphingomonas zeicaulis TaxID=1632740 RepID=UPI003D262E58